MIIQNRQRSIPVNTRLLRIITRTLLKQFFETADFDVAVYVVRAAEMARLNETYLQHRGSTDVITFDYSDSASQTRKDKLPLHGEIFVCIDDAIKQARHFRSTWPSELTRYIIHGLLHLQNFDDVHPAARRKMKREESRLLKELSRRFALRELASGSKLPA